MKQIKTISIKCDNEKTLELSEMTELQGGLKISNRPFRRDGNDFNCSRKVREKSVSYGIVSALL